ncbi:hypothetical protein BGZ96_012791 [Linnemannia gamsii]|uniref:Uncharacterized protein n=1 Tax=Linnemannia gamsii TaxID=64522 RepID=A0ABQ7JPS1_9FUNG|nr:hypothetical protein BGZ96_012791 [Linnemannia gamsii]
MIFKSSLLAFLASAAFLTTTAHASYFVITEHVARNVKCFQSYSNIGLVERSICWHDKEFYSDRWHDWPCEIDCEVNVPVRIYLEDYTYPYSLPSRSGSPGPAFTYRELQELQDLQGGRGQRAMVRGGRGGGGDRRSIYKIYIQRLDSEWQLVTYLRKGTGECKNEHDEEGWSIWGCAEIKTV